MRSLVTIVDIPTFDFYFSLPLEPPSSTFSRLFQQYFKCFVPFQIRFPVTAYNIPLICVALFFLLISSMILTSYQAWYCRFHPLIQNWNLLWFWASPSFHPLFWTVTEEQQTRLYLDSTLKHHDCLSTICCSSNCKAGLILQWKAVLISRWSSSPALS